ncbi:MAG: type II toxin-antitoxin system RelE/ParE family toxin [Ardenticatenales bacterium]|nr:type II toxin-antitoxin system RelE/ParE family toxin [Ardenticatenales bacterium]
MAYRLRYADAARRDLLDLAGNYRQRMRRTIEALAVQPKPAGAKELRERPGRYRIRVDRWRLIYRLDEEAGLVLILRVRRKSGPETYDDIE